MKKKPSQKHLDDFMRRAGGPIGSVWSEEQKRREAKLKAKWRPVPMAAHLYAAHFEKLRRLSVELSRAGKSVVEVQGFVRGAADMERLAAYGVMLDICHGPDERSCVASSVTSVALAAVDGWREGLQALDMHQRRFLEVASEFFQELREAGCALGPDFAKRLARHCSEVRGKSPLTTSGWGFFTSWLRLNEPEMADDLLADPEKVCLPERSSCSPFVV